MQSREGSSFSDIDAEGPFATNVGRDAADTYIREKIKDYEGILSYYKGRLNALTITCRIPPEMLAEVFGELQYSPSTNADSGPFDWIKTVSHVCSHWRRVALTTPELWTNIQINHPLWAMEMSERSGTVPLTIHFDERFLHVFHSTERCRRSSAVLRDILHSHHSRIKNLTFTLYSEYDERRGHDLGIFLELLDRPMPTIERLGVTISTEVSQKNMLPPEFFSMSSRLQHLRLVECAMSWNPDFVGIRNLRSLEISRLSRTMSPTMAQLLDVLSQTTLLEALNTDIQALCNSSDTALAKNKAPLNLQHLTSIATGSDLFTCAFLVDHIVFSSNAKNIILRLEPLQELPAFLLRSLAQRIDDGFAGPILKLALANRKVQCWKLADKDITFPKLPTINIGDFTEETGGPFFQSLRLDQLQLLEVDFILSVDEWSLFGDLPHLTSLQVFSNESSLLRVLLRRKANTPDPDTPPDRPAFVALRRLRISSWRLDALFRPRKNTSIIQLLRRYLKRRKMDGRGLHFLQVRCCRGVDENVLAPLRKFIKQIEWDGVDCNNYDTGEE
ncbi:hypothetical protein H2248_004322 [Termitomyces sp. 'cryptogamus']|nr:hypothetical protein H2248_004322 [Termitomyces sp. 'cryptogamus']